MGQSGCVDENSCFRLIEDTLNDDASAVLLKPSPLDSCLGAEAAVLNGDAERDAITRRHAEGDVLQVA